MRYLNWDVLIFPDTSKIPMQEFKTGCYVVQDPESLSGEMRAGAGHVFEHLSPPQVPIVACFLANLTDGSPFRVSVHSWEPPIATQGLQLTAKGGKKICFEARVFIDGLCISLVKHSLRSVFIRSAKDSASGILFHDKGPWPQVIEMSSQIDKAGQRDFLRWPPFHPEMLTQNYWNAGENMGRIKVTITEGYLHGPNELPFTRTRNLASFSFQHAPQHILETSGIAWPNAGMWYQPSRPTYKIASPTHCDPSDNLDLHAHSPRRRTVSTAGGIGLVEHLGSSLQLPLNAYRTMQPPAAPGLMNGPTLANWRSSTLMPDPFIDNSQRLSRRFLGRSSDSDQPMPDYSESGTPANSRRASIAHRDQHFFEDLDHFPNGLAAPANTRVNSAANTPSIQNKPSAAAEARVASYMLQSNADAKLLPKPTGEIKGRKEGPACELEVTPQLQKKASSDSFTVSEGDKENATVGVTAVVVTSDGKRKRTRTGSASQVSIRDEENISISPTRKVSKKSSTKSLKGNGTVGKEQTPEGKKPSRVALVSLDNI